MKRILDYPALTPAEVTEAVERIVADCQPETILVFGSRARGEAHVESDVDLLVLLAEKVPSRWAVCDRLHALLAKASFAKDILVSDPEHFALWSAQINSVYNDATEEGIAVWKDGCLVPAAIEIVCRHRILSA